MPDTLPDGDSMRADFDRIAARYNVATFAELGDVRAPYAFEAQAIAMPYGDYAPNANPTDGRNIELFRFDLVPAPQYPHSIDTTEAVEHLGEYVAAELRELYADSRFGYVVGEQQTACVLWVVASNDSGD